MDLWQVFYHKSPRWIHCCEVKSEEKSEHTIYVRFTIIWAISWWKSFEHPSSLVTSVSDLVRPIFSGKLGQNYTWIHCSGKMLTNFQGNFPLFSHYQASSHRQIFWEIVECWSHSIWSIFKQIMQMSQHVNFQTCNIRDHIIQNHSNCHARKYKDIGYLPVRKFTVIWGGKEAKLCCCIWPSHWFIKKSIYFTWITWRWRVHGFLVCEGARRGVVAVPVPVHEGVLHMAGQHACKYRKYYIMFYKNI